MSRKQKLLLEALNNPKGLRFEELLLLASYFGFELERVKGSHHIFRHSTIPIKLNLQAVKNQAKPYQVQQLLNYIEEFQLKLGGEEE